MHLGVTPRYEFTVQPDPTGAIGTRLRVSHSSS
jgi:hypothetical protein